MHVSRTNIDLDDDKVERVMRRYGLRTKTEAVDLALEIVAGRPMTKEEALAMHGANAMDHLPPDDPPPDL